MEVFSTSCNCQVMHNEGNGFLGHCVKCFIESVTFYIPNSFHCQVIFQVIALWNKFNNEKIMNNVTIVFMMLNFRGSRMCAWSCVYACLCVCVCGQFRKTQFLR